MAVEEMIKEPLEELAEELPIDHQYILNLSGKITGRSNTPFPIVDTFLDTEKNSFFNQVTFVYYSEQTNNAQDKIAIFLIGNFDSLHTKRKLHQIIFNNELTRFYAITLKLPVKKRYHYQFLIDDSHIIDPLNTLTKQLDNNVIWSEFFTESIKSNIILEEWEAQILRRLISYILPFKTNEFKTFVKNHQGQFSELTKSLISQISYDIGCVNFIDKLISRDELHHIINYKLCLKEIKRILFALNTFQEPKEMDEYFYQRIYQIMSQNDFTIWNKATYENPSYFIMVLRRHIITAAFSHPKHGGNTDALGWQFLDSLLRNNNHDGAGFDWQQALEKPLGINNDYIG